MPNSGIARIFMHGRSQAVRLPLAFRLPGDRVRLRRVAGGILLEPMLTDVGEWFAAAGSLRGRAVHGGRPPAAADARRQGACLRDLPARHQRGHRVAEGPARGRARPVAPGDVARRVDRGVVGRALRTVVRRRTQRTPPRERRTAGRLPVGRIDVVAFDAEDAATAGELRATLEADGTPIGPYDVLIAAQALRSGATLVTANVSEFARVRDLAWQDWSAPA